MKSVMLCLCFSLTGPLSVPSVSILPLPLRVVSVLCDQSFGSLSSSGLLWHSPAYKANTHASAMSTSHPQTSNTNKCSLSPQTCCLPPLMTQWGGKKVFPPIQMSTIFASLSLFHILDQWIKILLHPYRMSKYWKQFLVKIVFVEWKAYFKQCDFM